MGLRPGYAIYPIPDKFSEYGTHINHDRLETASLSSTDFGRWATKVVTKENDSVGYSEDIKGIYTQLDSQSVLVAGLVQSSDTLLLENSSSLMDLSSRQVAQVIRAQATGYGAVIFASGSPKGFVNIESKEAPSVEGLRLYRANSYDPSSILDLYLATTDDIFIRHDGRWLSDDGLSSIISSANIYTLPERYYSSAENSVDLATKGLKYEKIRSQLAPVISSSIFLTGLYKESSRISAICNISLCQAYSEEVLVSSSQGRLLEFGTVKVCWTGESDG